MAKTKKKEETIDLSKPSKVKDEQLKKIQSIVDRLNQYQMQKSYSNFPSLMKAT